MPTLLRSLFAALLITATFTACGKNKDPGGVVIKGGPDDPAVQKQAKKHPDGGGSPVEGAPKGNAPSMADVNASADGGADGGLSADDARQQALQAMRALGPLKVGASATPNAEMINATISDLKSQGLDVQVTIFDDPDVANSALVHGDLDASFLQTAPHLGRWRAAHGGDLAVAGRIYVAPMGIWSRRVTNVAIVRDGARVAVPRDPENLGRALLLLRKADLIDVDPAKGFEAAIADVILNKHKLKFDLEPADKVAALYNSEDMVVCNASDVLEFKLPITQALLREDETSPFPNVVAAPQSKLNDPRVVALVAALHGPAVRKLIETKYNGAVIPVP